MKKKLLRSSSRKREPGSVSSFVRSFVRIRTRSKSKSKTQEKKNKTLCLVAMFKNESHILEEWLEHYLAEGVSHFILIDNGSTDGYMRVLEKPKFQPHVTLFIDSRRNLQTSMYNEYALPICQKFEWTFVCDLDEFLYAKNGFQTVAEYLVQVPSSVVQIMVPWKLFGSSGWDSVEKKQPKSVVSSFTRRTNYNKSTGGFHGVVTDRYRTRFSINKCLVRSRALVSFGVHSHQVEAGQTSVTSNVDETHPSKKLSWTLEGNQNFAFSRIDEGILRQSALNLNHYAIQSLDWFMRVKATRGDGVYKHCDNVRDEGYFRSYDAVSSDVEDWELLVKHRKFLEKLGPAPGIRT
jgi:hypothetical protein